MTSTTWGLTPTYGSANGVANNETFHGFGQWNHLFSPLWYGYLRGEGLHDGICPGEIPVLRSLRVWVITW